MESQSSSSDEGEGESGHAQRQSARDSASADTPSPDHHQPEDQSHQVGVSGKKRRRVTRACDECRRKKIKCDGKQPCTHCTVYSYECSYDQPSHRRRNPAPQYIEALETRLARAEAIVRTYLPNLDINDPALDRVLEQQGPIPRSSCSNFGSSNTDKGSSHMVSNDPTLDAMVESTGQLDLDEKGHWDYTGGSSGLSFVRGVRYKLSDLKRADSEEVESKEEDSDPTCQIRVPSPPPYVGEEPALAESPYASTYVGKEELPSKEEARQLCIHALEDASAVLQIVHSPTFYHRFDRIYDLPPEAYDNEDHKFLALLYGVIALGCLFAPEPAGGESEQRGYKKAMGVGYKYFWASRSLMDVTDCRDLTSLQAIVYMVFFLQCSAKLSTCYSFIGIALRSALRMGLHRSFKDNFNPIEAETRKRVFWVIRKMDIDVGAMLGFPQTLSDEDIDQDYPTNVDDDHISLDGIVPMPDERMSLMAATTANFRLAKILNKIVRTIYPIKSCPASDTGSPRSFCVSYPKIKEIEMDLQRWQESLPPQLQPSEKTASKSLRQLQLLRMLYSHTQMMLYRPFLHYVSPRNQSKPINQRAQACAAACVSVSRNIIHITADMKRRGLLEGSYWFTIYTTYFGVLSLTFFALENPDSSARKAAVIDAKEGKETLAKMARRSMAADRCSSSLKVLFEQIGDDFEKTASPVISTKQRTGETSTQDPSPQSRSIKSDLASEGSRRNSKNVASGGSNGYKGSVAPRQRGMRLISQTGRPSVPKQQQSQTRSSPPRQSSTPPLRQQQQSHQPNLKIIQHQPFTQMHHPLGMPSPNPYLSNLPAEQPPTTSPPSTFNTPPQNQYGIPAPEQQHQQYPFMPQFQTIQYPADSISSLSNLMFPSDNPFHYPNQPMTTLERAQAMAGTDPDFKQHTDMYSAQHPNAQGVYLPPSSSDAYMPASDEHIDAQPFGPLHIYGTGSDVGIGVGVDSAHQTMLSSSSPSVAPRAGMSDTWDLQQERQRQHQQQQQHQHQHQQQPEEAVPGLNFDHVFADNEWRG